MGEIKQKVGLKARALPDFGALLICGLSGLGVWLLQLELELIQTQMAQKPMLRAEVYARALRASQKRERERMYGWARDASDEWAGRGRVREWKALVWGWRDL